jgi:hypothetical protein
VVKTSKGMNSIIFNYIQYEDTNVSENGSIFSKRPFDLKKTPTSQTFFQTPKHIQNILLGCEQDSPLMDCDYLQYYMCLYNAHMNYQTTGVLNII